MRENKIIKSIRPGWIEVITGPMFCGKTEELIRRLKRVQIARQNSKLFKPLIDERYSVNEVVSHDHKALKSNPVKEAKEILRMVNRMSVIGIDEAQFFDESLVDVCNALANRGFRVIVAGLDMDYTGKPFGPIPALLATAEYITKLQAICLRCGDLAHFSYRKAKEMQLVLIGEIEKYQPLCRKCFNRQLKNVK